ncbi:hypothetical protein STENM327S_02476 [Streptomyces tendae]
MLIPNKARHKTNAERLIDYYYEPGPPQTRRYINFACPVDGVKDDLAKIDEDAANNPLIIPDKAMHASRLLPLPESEGVRHTKRSSRSSPGRDDDDDQHDEEPDGRDGLAAATSAWPA